MIPNKEIIAFYLHDTKGRSYKQHKYEIYTGDRSVLGHIYLKSGLEIPQKLIIELKIREVKK